MEGVYWSDSSFGLKRHTHFVLYCILVDLQLKEDFKLPAFVAHQTDVDDWWGRNAEPYIKSLAL